MRTRVKDLLSSAQPQTGITARGWVRTFRNNQFVALNDGSTIHNIQCVVDFENTPDETLKRITTGAAIAVTGDLVESSRFWAIQIRRNSRCNPSVTRSNS
jgi:asparaginyl-tRNA synthetase